MDNLEVIDKVRSHLLEQGKKAVTRPYEDDTEQCQYRVKKGNKTLKCAVGCLIPDNLYDPAMEGQGVLALMQNFSEVKEIFQGVSRTLLCRLQQIHDNTHPDFWESQLNKLEKEYSNES